METFSRFTARLKRPAGCAWLWAILLVICGTPFKSVAAEKSNEAERVYDKERRISLVLPSSWQEVDAEPPYVLMFRAPAGEFTPNLNIVITGDDGTPLDQVSEQIKQSMPTYFTDWRVVKDGFSKLDGHKVYVICSKYSEGELTLRGLQYFLVSNGTLYVVTLTSSSDQFGKLKPTFKKIADSVRVEQ